ncbi:DUF924 family protein [Methylocystis sp. SB2]|uniref:DUF924 family protein n=1 Tax=Methylocystis sp. (strain SB2) TaxID=743836 RepID=UPI001EFBC2A6|nr:DUF924 family protein [Methylocystis sp. SB2]ULO23934.1 DUF924 family protein [Methylocystis sp. SB2]
MTDPPASAIEVIDFWREAGPDLWFAKNAEFDQRFRDRFLDLHDVVARGGLWHWLETSAGALALVLLLDQFPRNAFRNAPRMCATDGLAREIAAKAIEAGFDRDVEPQLQGFFYLPFGHSESLSDQERSVTLASRLGGPFLAHAEGHCDIVRRFGRFPHRNPIFGRESTEEERRFLEDGGYAG